MSVQAASRALLVAATLALAVPAGARASTITRAGLDPGLVAGRGAQVGFVEQEAENASTSGGVIGPGRDASTLPAKASGRSAVRLDAAGQYVQFTLTRDTNALT